MMYNMRTNIILLLIFIDLNALICKNVRKSYRYPCIRNKEEGFCVPQMNCCSNWNNWNYYDRGNCSRQEFCCTSGSILCQSCDEGTKKVNETCVDINECEETYGLCSGHKCINSYGDYTCECFDSYQMIGNLKTCKHMNQSESADILFSGTRTINLLQLSAETNASKSIEMIYSGTVTPKSLDYSFAGNYIAWTDITLNQINIAPINYKNPSLVRDRVILRYIKNPICLAIDWIHNLLYWSDLETRTINVADIFKPNDYYIVINVTDQEPHDLLVNVIDNVLVWNHVGLKPRIMRSYQDGSNQSVLYSTFKQTFCITIDIFLKRYYFIDIEDFSLNSINFEGKDERIIYTSRNLINSINSMSVYYDHIFMATDDLIFKMNKFGHFDTVRGNKVYALVKTSTFQENDAVIIDNVTDSYGKQLFGIKIIDPILQPELENKCQFAKCSHLCLPSDRDNIFRCFCPTNNILVNFTVCTEKRFKALVMDSLSWESDLQKLINYSISKSIDLRKLLNQSFNEQIDLNMLFNNSFKETIEIRKLFNFMSKQSIQMKNTFIQSLNETLFWKKLLNITFHNKSQLEELLNKSLNTNNMTEVLYFLNNLTKSEPNIQHIPENNSRKGEQVILAFILIGIFVIIILFLLIGFKLKLITFKRNSYQSSQHNPLYRKSQDINSFQEMESKT